ncbi:hypothetical protein [Vibrio viridaestus]|uniref:Uncharacterized protein n=1 Tax=Vibrio viridaestus TaxID=2487322 RepID=A0A3N9TB95_9VIBR|nr:hypothetical protein [Vibrio viridaestus]RQW61024.1 hypothetical protein EES38_21485 [Vibrio viridaestus]
MKGLINEIDKEIARNKPKSWARLMWQGVKTLFKSQNERLNEIDAKVKSLKDELNRLRDFVNSPDENDKAA